MSCVRIRKANVTDFPLLLQYANVVKVVEIAIVSVVPSMVYSGVSHDIRGKYETDLHCISGTCSWPILVNAKLIAASACSNVVPLSGGHHLVKAIISFFDKALCWPITNSMILY